MKIAGKKISSQSASQPASQLVSQAKYYVGSVIPIWISNRNNTHTQSIRICQSHSLLLLLLLRRRLLLPSYHCLSRLIPLINCRLDSRLQLVPNDERRQMLSKLPVHRRIFVFNYLFYVSISQRQRHRCASL